MATASLIATSFTRLQGRVVEQGPGLGIFAPSLATEPGLYVFVEPTVGEAGEACEQAVRTIERTFRRRRGAITTRLSEAIKAVHQELLLANRRLPQQDRLGLGITCVVRRGRELYVAQAGPSFFAIHQPDGIFWLGPQSRTPPRPIGTLGSLAIQWHRHQLREGDVLLTATSSLLRLIGPDALEQLLLLAPDQAIAHLYDLARNERVFSLLYLGPTHLEADEELPPAGALSAGKLWEIRSALANQLPPSRITLRRLLAATSLLLAGAIFAMTVVTIPRFVAHQEALRHSRALAQARSLYASAAQEGDRGRARVDLVQALDHATVAQEGQQTRHEAQALTVNIESEIQKVNAVRPLSDITVAADLYRLGQTKAQIERVWVMGGTAYLLDRSEGILFSVNLASPNALSQPLDALPIDRWGQASSLLGMPPGTLRTKGALLTLDRQRHLAEVAAPIPGEARESARPLPLRAPDRWTSILGSAGYMGNLYILDGQANQIWRYLPTDSGYDSEMKGVLEQASGLNDAVDMGIDGDIYILTGGGRLLRFAAGREVPFSMSGLDQPLRRPTGLFVNPQTQFVYVADTGNDRVVAFDKEGNFAFQMRSANLRAPQGLYVDEAQRRIYITVAQQLLTASLPTQ